MRVNISVYHFAHDVLCIHGSEEFVDASLMKFVFTTFYFIADEQEPSPQAELWAASVERKTVLASEECTLQRTGERCPTVPHPEDR
jgi:hypothetical protein